MKPPETQKGMCKTCGKIGKVTKKGMCLGCWVKGQPTGTNTQIRSGEY